MNERLQREAARERELKALRAPEPTKTAVEGNIKNKVQTVSRATAPEEQVEMGPRKAFRLASGGLQEIRIDDTTQQLQPGERLDLKIEQKRNDMVAKSTSSQKEASFLTEVSQEELTKTPNNT